MADIVPTSASILVSTGLAAESTGGAAAQLEREVVQLFDAFRKPVLRYLLGIGLPVEDAEEIVQEVFLALFQHLRRGKARHNLRGWMFRVAHNLGLKKRKQRGMIPGAVGQHPVADPSPNPEDQYANAQQQGRLLAVVNALSEQDRACLFLRAEGLRYREITQTLGMSLGAVSISLARSIARIGRAAER